MRSMILCVLVVTLFSSLSFGQIPNGGFENWVTDPDTNFNPMSWQTTNSYPLVNVERYSPGFQGSYALKVKTLNPGFPFPGMAFLEAAYNFSQMPTKFSARIKATIMPGDQAFLIVGLMKGDSVIASQDSCTFKILSTISQFTYYEFPLTLQSSLIPDSLVIFVASGLGGGQVGTELIVDDLAFIYGPTSVPLQGPVPGSFALHQNYPNPFNPSTNIAFDLPTRGFVSLIVFDVLGREVARLVSQHMEAGHHAVPWDASRITSGTYFYRIQSGTQVETKRLVLVR